jgi:hypothetical protein
MAQDYLVPWLGASGQGGLRNSMLVAAGDGATTLYTFNFAGGYIAKSDVRGYIYNPATGTASALTITAGMWQTDSQIKLASPVPTGQYIVLYRDTQKSTPLVDFTNGAVLNEQNLDKMAQQGIFVAAEMADRFDLLNDGSVLAIQQAATAITTANAASAKSDTAISTANGAVTTAGGAVTTAGGAVTTANTAKATADTAKATADTAKATADGIDAKATSALTNANSAVTTANGIDAKASTALTNANTAVTTANTAKTTADTAKSTADGVDAKATSALSTANSAAASVATALLKTGGDMSGSIVSTASAFQYRSINANYGCMWHQDANNMYLLSTAYGDQRGTFNAFRPLYYNLASGNLYLGDSGHGVSVGSDLTIKHQSSNYSYPLRMYGGSYSPIVRVNGNTASLEVVNQANTALNFSVADNGNTITRGTAYIGANAQVAGDGNVYGSVWNNDWLSNYLNARFGGKQDIANLVRGLDGGNTRYGLSWDGKVRAWVDGQHQGAIWTDAFITCNGANGRMNFDSCQQLGYANGNRDLPYFMNNGTYSWFVTQRNGTSNVNLPVRSNGYIEWITDIGTIGTNYFTSDASYKENIAPNTKSYAEQVAAIKFVSFDFKQNDLQTNAGRHWDLGVIAQQIESDVDDAYIDYLSDGTLSLNTNKLLVLALKTIQELQARVDALEAVPK